MEYIESGFFLTETGGFSTPDLPNFQVLFYSEIYIHITGEFVQTFYDYMYSSEMDPAEIRFI